eukprot:scaffold33124_cov27-Phaeocystis_antarctica.AAC.1
MHDDRAKKTDCKSNHLDDPRRERRGVAAPRLLTHEHHVVARQRHARLGARGEQRGQWVGRCGVEHDGVQRAINLQLTRRLGAGARDHDRHVGTEAGERARELAVRRGAQDGGGGGGATRQHGASRRRVEPIVGL